MCPGVLDDALAESSTRLRNPRRYREILEGIEEVTVEDPIRRIRVGRKKGELVVYKVDVEKTVARLTLTH